MSHELCAYRRPKKLRIDRNLGDANQPFPRARPVEVPSGLAVFENQEELFCFEVVEESGLA